MGKKTHLNRLFRPNFFLDRKVYLLEDTSNRHIIGLKPLKAERFVIMGRHFLACKVQPGSSISGKVISGVE